MGITGLIPFLEKASSKVHLKEIKGSTVAIDTYCWLHKGVFSCADKLARGEDSDVYVQYCLKYVNMLLTYDIKPILIFDGRHLPAKDLTEKRRRTSRKEAKEKGKQLLREGKVEEARSLIKRSIDVTHEMALKVIKECRRRNVDCIVAPYEADAQMAYLNKLNIAEYVITEDSDLVLFGTKKVIFKLDLTAQGLLVDASKLHLAMGCPETKYTFDKFRRMAILSGCDYIDSLPGVGLVKACKFVLLTEETDMRKAIPKIPQYLKLKNSKIPEDYVDNFLKAEATFQHMYVYDPLKREVVRLNEIPKDNPDILDLCSNAGNNDLSHDVAFNLALGNINPFGLKVLDDWNPDTHKPAKINKYDKLIIAKHKSVWLEDFARHAPKLKDSDIRSAFQFKSVNIHNISLKTTIDEPVSEEDDDLLDMYTKQNELPSKVQLTPSDSSEDELEVSIDKKRNPFGKNICDLNKSPLKKISKSLIKAASPVKMKIEVKSRFFSDDSTAMPTSAKRKIEDFTENSPKRSNCITSSDTRHSDSPKIEFSPKSEEITGVDGNNESDDDVIIISEEKVEVKKSFLTAPSLASSKTKTKAKPAPKAKTKKVDIKPANQTSLAMFGFRKSSI